MMCDPDPYPVTLAEAHRDALAQEERWQREDAATFRAERGSDAPVVGWALADWPVD